MIQARWTRRALARCGWVLEVFPQPATDDMSCWIAEVRKEGKSWRIFWIGLDGASLPPWGEKWTRSHWQLARRAVESRLAGVVEVVR